MASNVLCIIFRLDMFKNCSNLDLHHQSTRMYIFMMIISKGFWQISFRISSWNISHNWIDSLWHFSQTANRPVVQCELTSFWRRNKISNKSSTELCVKGNPEVATHLIWDHVQHVGRKYLLFESRCHKHMFPIVGVTNKNMPFSCIVLFRMQKKMIFLSLQILQIHL